jgi:3-hydroxyisobutyrate dehydrogenase
VSSSNNKLIVGWIGTGVMGRYMCEHIMPLASKTVIYNRTVEKTRVLADAGAIVVNSPKEVAEQADIVFTIVGHPKDVRDVYFGEFGLFSASPKGSLFIDMTTTEPSLSIEIEKMALSLGCNALDAPVSGGDVGAKEARLTIMVGGKKSCYDTALPFFNTMGTATLQGGPGSGQHTKMCNQIVIAGTMAGVCESLLYARKAGLDGNNLIETISKGAAGCWSLQNLAPRIIDNNYHPGFMIDHFVKDMGIALAEAKKMSIALPSLALVEQLYISLQSSSQGHLGTQALVLALDRINDTHLFST